MPLRPALSGLRLRYPAGMPRQLAHLLISLAYRWHPSAEYRRRQAEMRRMNARLRNRPPRNTAPPPIFMYGEDNFMSPTRVQPYLPASEETGLPLRELPRDLRDLEQQERLRSAPIIRPLLPAPDTDYAVAYRPLLPRQYRRFLWHSPYPRLLAGAALATGLVAGSMWLTQIQQAEAVARGQLHRTQRALQAELDAARVYGVAPARLQPIAQRAEALADLSGPSGLMAGRARVGFYRQQRRDYTHLLHRLKQLEKASLRYWSWRARQAEAELQISRRGASALGLRLSPAAPPACRTPRCYQAEVAADGARMRWLRETAATLRVYGAQIAASPDPAGAAGGEIAAVHNLRAVLPTSAPAPAPVADLDGMYAGAAGVADYARVGALAHLDADALQADLLRTLAPRAIVISTEEQSMTCYQRGKAVYRSAAAADSATPIGIFHIEVKQASIPALYWRRAPSLRYYRSGTLPDWMLFSGHAALQGAPWRTVFGPDSAAVSPLLAPVTPGSVDLPLPAAQYVFGWAPVGTEVVVW